MPEHGTASAPKESAIDERELEAEAERERRHALAELIRLFPELMTWQPDLREEPDWAAVRDTLASMSPEELRDVLGDPAQDADGPADLPRPVADGQPVLDHPGDDDGTGVTTGRAENADLDHPGDRPEDELTSEIEAGVPEVDDADAVVTDG